MTTKLLRLNVNGVEHAVAAPPQAILLDVLRETLGLTGSKRGCDMGTCGCCTVQVDGVARLSCLTLAATVEGARITTIEGLAPEGGALHPLQKSFAECGGSQCGFCTPGFIMTCQAFLRDVPDPTDAEIREAISGNMCRCTGYVKIIEAVKTAAGEMRAERVPPEQVDREQPVVER
ncbi:MAG TPA: (2Fe-2S)-binding protein [Candidatus Thermoplasmatota archaeon]|nr:(2Fe-2S)-binding protein [Candidatus Thermoplasmatota archaeon]